MALVLAFMNLYSILHIVFVHSLLYFFNLVLKRQTETVNGSTSIS